MASWDVSGFFLMVWYHRTLINLKNLCSTDGAFPSMTGPAVFQQRMGQIKLFLCHFCDLHTKRKWSCSCPQGDVTCDCCFEIQLQTQPVLLKFCQNGWGSTHLCRDLLLFSSLYKYLPLPEDEHENPKNEKRALGLCEGVVMEENFRNSKDWDSPK